PLPCNILHWQQHQPLMRQQSEARASPPGLSMRRMTALYTFDSEKNLTVHCKKITPGEYFLLCLKLPFPCGMIAAPMRIFSMNCSAIIPELDILSGLRTRLISPEALIMAIQPPLPVNPRVHFLTRQYL
ncbi:envelope glycoprotein H, partial [Striga asiatica]